MNRLAYFSIAFAFLATLTTTSALADNTGKPYLAADLGSATYSNMDPLPNPGVFRIAGGYHINQTLAVELGYSKFGDSTVTDFSGTATVTASSVQVVIIGSLPLSPEFDLIGKVGLANNNAEANVSLTGFGSGSASTSESDLMFGLGAQYHVNSQISIRALYDNYGKFDNSSNPMKASSISAGVVINF